jgi:hypothetical protein
MQGAGASFVGAIYIAATNFPPSRAATLDRRHSDVRNGRRMAGQFGASIARWPGMLFGRKERRLVDGNLVRPPSERRTNQLPGRVKSIAEFQNVHESEADFVA